jgi:hypothetical protein
VYLIIKDTHLVRPNPEVIYRMGHHGMRTIFLGWLLTGLFAFGFFLIPGIEFLEQILGGLITDLDVFMSSLPAPFNSLGYLGATVVERVLFDMYPLSWSLYYRPDDAFTIFIMIVPWLASGACIAGMFSDNPKDALISGIGLICSNSMLMATLYIILPLVFMNLPVLAGNPVFSVFIGALNGFAEGFTDLPMGVSAILTQVEGGGIYTAMAVFIGVLKSGREK